MNKANLFLATPKTGKSKIKALAGPALSEGMTSDSEKAMSSVLAHGPRADESTVGIFLRNTNLIPTGDRCTFVT